MNWFRTGETIYEQILSLDGYNNPITGVTFTSYMFRNGEIYTGVTIAITLSHAISGSFTSSWSASTIGDYQMIVKNDQTDVVFESDVYRVRDNTEFDQNIYIGL